MEISPLFAVDAEELLEEGKTQEAIDLCLAGLEEYPGYPAGEAVLAKAYKISGDEEKANQRIEKFQSKNPNIKSFNAVKSSTKEQLIEQSTKKKIKKNDIEENLDDLNSIDDANYIEENESNVEEEIKESIDGSAINDENIEDEETSEEFDLSQFEENLDDDELEDQGIESEVFEENDDEFLEKSSESTINNQTQAETNENKEKKSDDIITSGEELSNYDDSEDFENLDYEFENANDETDQDEEIELNPETNENTDIFDFDNIESDLDEDYEFPEESLSQDKDVDLAIPEFTGYEDETEKSQPEVIEYQEEDFEDTNAETEEEIELSAFEIDLIPGLISKFELFDRELKHEEDFFGIKSLPDFENKYTAKDVLALPKTEKRKDILEMSIKYIKEDNRSRLTELSEEIDDKLDVEEIQPTVIRDSRKSNSYTLTLARIYEEQGAVKDAIEIYKKLIEQNPKEKDFYESRIKELS